MISDFRFPISDFKTHQPRAWGHPSPVCNPKSAIGNPQSAILGYTLLELTVTLLITAIVLTVGIASMGRTSLVLSQGESVSSRLAADLRYAQSEAIAKASYHRIVFTSGLAKYTSYTINRVDPLGENIQIEPTRVLPDTVALTGTSASAVYTPSGDALAAYVYTVTCPGRTYRVSVALATGAVRLEELSP